MTKDFKTWMLVLIFGLPLFLILFISLLYFGNCGFGAECAYSRLPAVIHTPIPTLIPASLPTPVPGTASALAGKCTVSAETILGSWVSAGYPEKDPFNFTDANGAACEATFADLQPLFTDANLWYTGALACSSCHNANVSAASAQLDLSSYAGILAGSRRSPPDAQGQDILGGGVWEQSKLYDMLFVQKKMPFGRPAGAVADQGPVILAGQQAVAEPGSAGGGEEVARPSNPGGPGEAVNLTGDAAAGAAVYSAQCASCHGDQGLGGLPNPGSDDGTIPPLNPIDETLISPDYTTYATNLDLFIQHGSTPAGPNPSKNMPAWGDQNAITQQQIADVIAYLIGLNPAEAEVARPSNPGGPGDAVNLTGDATAGAAVYSSQCASCHGDQGLGGLPNPGSDDGTIPPLNPIDETLISPDYTTYATNLDLFIQHGSTPAGPNPSKNMPAWGDKNTLTQQQIADVIAYLIELNPAPIEVARPSNPGGPGDAVNLTGDATAGATIFSSQCATCHGDQGVGGVTNPGSDDGTVPPLNPIDETLIDPDYTTYATNLDLFIQHGSTPAGTDPSRKMPALGDSNTLTQQQIANVIAYLIGLNPPPVEVARPSNPGGPGDAVNLTGDATAGAAVYSSQCASCHGDQGLGGLPNPGSDDGTIPPLNPIDETLISPDYTTYATNLDLFIQHGSTPAGPNPSKNMPAWGDQNALTQQQIADVIAYLIDLNK